MKKVDKKIRVEYKVALSSLATLILMNLFYFIFVLLPIYSLVGEGIDNTSTASEKLDTYEVFAGVSMVVSSILVAVLIISSTLGIYKDAQRKSQK
jgi:ABC-type spermidine/putrescine transport system permease subunit I